MKNQSIRQLVEQLFGLPAMKMPWNLYLAQLNEAGKLTARSNMDMMTVILEVMEEQEEKIKDLELLTQRVETTEPIQTISTEPIKKEFYDQSPIDFLKSDEAKEHILVAEEPKDLQKEVSKVTEEVVDKGLVDAILGDKPQEEKPQEPTK